MDKFRQFLIEGYLFEGKNDKKDKKDKKMLGRLHELDDKIEEFIDGLEDKIIDIQDNPTFVKKATQLLADMSKEYSEFIVALRAVVNAVDRKGQMIPGFEKTESRVRDVMDGAGNGPPPEGEEEGPPEGEEGPPPEEEGDEEFELKVAKKDKKKKKKGIKEALEGI